jgi:hypothetical protein
MQKMDTDNQTTTTNLPIDVDSRWVHMNNVEYEKLEWMKDLPKPSAQHTVDDSVRYFRFCNLNRVTSIYFIVESRRCPSTF